MFEDLDDQLELHSATSRVDRSTPHDDAGDISLAELRTAGHGAAQHGLVPQDIGVNPELDAARHG